MVALVLAMMLLRVAPGAGLARSMANNVASLIMNLEMNLLGVVGGVGGCVSIRQGKSKWHGRSISGRQNRSDRNSVSLDEIIFMCEIFT